MSTPPKTEEVCTRNLDSLKSQLESLLKDLQRPGEFPFNTIDRARQTLSRALGLLDGSRPRTK